MEGDEEQRLIHLLPGSIVTVMLLCYTACSNSHMAHRIDTCLYVNTCLAHFLALPRTGQHQDGPYLWYSRAQVSYPMTGFDAMLVMQPVGICSHTFPLYTLDPSQKVRCHHSPYLWWQMPSLLCLFPEWSKGTARTAQQGRCCSWCCRGTQKQQQAASPKPQ